MSNAVARIDEAPSVLASMASRFGMDKRAFEATLRSTVMPGNTSNEQAAAFLLVAHQYNLNPFTKEIYAFPSRGGIQPIVSIDGWMKLINSHPQFDGMEFKDAIDDKGALVSVTCRVFRKDRGHPVEVTEYMAECRRNTDTWKQWPARMLRHKATIQAARYAFGFAGILEPDEAERVAVIDAKSEIVEPERIELQPYPDDAFAENLPKWLSAIESRKLTADEVIDRASSKGVLTPWQIEQIRCPVVEAEPEDVA
jgi:phage recombination protein Bet